MNINVRMNLEHSTLLLRRFRPSASPGQCASRRKTYYTCTASSSIHANVYTNRNRNWNTDINAHAHKHAYKCNRGAFILAPFNNPSANTSTNANTNNNYKHNHNSAMVVPSRRMSTAITMTRRSITNFSLLQRNYNYSSHTNGNSSGSDIGFTNQQHMMRPKRIQTQLISMSTSSSNNGGADVDVDANADADADAVSNINIDINIGTDALSQTPLGKDDASHLLNGLDVYTIYSHDDQKHPISLYGIHSIEKEQESDNNDNDNDTDTDTYKYKYKYKNRRPILLLHGRTWSSVPVYHLLGGEQEQSSSTSTLSSTTSSPSSSRSLMEALYEKGLQPYALDFRGFGGTPSDSSNVVTPNTCVCDVGYALDFITKKHSLASSSSTSSSTSSQQQQQQQQQQHLPALLGWSQGALVAQLFAQKSPHLISKLVLYGSIYDPLISYPPIPLYSNGTTTNNNNNNDIHDHNRIPNTFNAAIEDFTIEGSIPPEPATKFAQAALLSDPYKANWYNLSQFNNLDPARITVPTLVVAGDQDPYAPIRVQASLFEHLGRGADRTWSIIADADHAVHLLDEGRERFVNF